MAQLPCPFLSGEVELTGERERHIAERHPDLLPENSDLMAAPWPILIWCGAASTWETPGCFLVGLTIFGAVNTWWSWW
jgi:hypothetical protein